MLGTDANIEDKIAFDPTRAKRRVLYLEVLELFKNYNVYSKTVLYRGEDTVVDGIKYLNVEEFLKAL